MELTDKLMDIKIGLAKEKDRKNLLEYFRKYDTNFSEDFTKNRIDYYIVNHFITLVKKDKKIIGHLFFQAKETPKLGVGEFETVNIQEDYRGRGIGTELIEKSINFAKNYFGRRNIKMRCLYLMTRSNNVVAQKVYGKFGFKKKNKIGKIFRDNQPEEIIMTKFF